MGDNGVLTQAQKAKIKTEKAKDQELRGLTAAEAGGNLEGTKFTGTLTTKQEDNTEKSETKEIPIPAGFAVSQVEGENIIDDGLVVIDSNGNEFVWIPCDEDTYEKAGNYSKKKSTEGESDNGEKGWSSYAYDTEVSGQTGDAYKAKTWNNPEKQITTAKESIKKYGGFYVARYEAGIPNNTPFYISNTSGGSYVGVDGVKNVSTTNGSVNARGANSETEKVKDLKPVSKREVQAWNFISQTNAVTVSENMYKDSDSVDSFLIDSNAWNHICQSIFIEKFGLSTTDSTAYGNYYNNKTTDYTSLDCLWAKHSYNSGWTYASEYGKGSITSDVISGRSNGNRLELATGASDDFKVYNIYDMAGNMWEWTSETGTVTNGSNGTTYAVVRGGSFHNNGAGGPVVHTYGDNSTANYYVDVGFRVVLYVK